MPTLKQTIKTVLRRTFDIREGEYRTAILMQLNIFLLISTLLIVKPNINALFLSRFGAERLPEAFVVVAVTALLFSLLYSRLLNRIPFDRILRNTLWISFAILLLFLMLLRTPFLEGLTIYLFYVWVAVFALLATSQFWLLSNMVYNVREAKRLFGFIGAGAISGGIFGGYLTTILAPVVGSENVLFAAAFLLLICIPLNRLIWYENLSTLSVYRRRRRIQDLAENPVSTIRNSRHLLYLAAMIGISVVVSKFVDYQFSDIAHRNFSDPDELAAFFGFWFSSLNLFSLFIQLFFTSRIVEQWGVGGSLLFLPASIFLGALLLLIFPGLTAAVLIKAADSSFKQSINKSATELLGLPIPLEIKNRTKTFIDVVVDSLATGAAGLILIFIVNGFGLETRWISLAIIVLIAIWGYFIRQVRLEYLRTYRTELRKTSPSPDTSNGLILPETSIRQGLESVLQDGSTDQILYVLKKVREIQKDHLFDAVHRLLGHPDPAVRADAIRTLYSYRRHALVEEIKTFIGDPDEEVKEAAFEYLFKYADDETAESFVRYLDHPDGDIADAALMSLALETRNNQTLKERYQLEARIQQKLERIETNTDPESIRKQKCRLLRLIGQAHIPRFFPVISRMLRDPDPEISGTALVSAGLTLEPEFIPELVKALARSPVRDQAREGLAKYGFPVIDRLEQLAINTAIPQEARLQVPSVLELFNTQQAVNALLRLLKNEDPDLRMEVVQSLNALHASAPELLLPKKKIAQHILEEGQLYLDTLAALYAEIITSFKQKRASLRPEEEETRRKLIALLEQRLDSDLERIFALLDLKYPSDDIEIALDGIRSSNPKQRNSAIEYLDNLLEPDLKRILIPIVETTVIDPLSDESLRSLSFQIPTERECFQTLLSRKDPQIRLAVLNLITELNDPGYIPLLEKYRHRGALQVQEATEKALYQLKENDPGN